MGSPIEPENPISLTSVFTETVGFVVGFIVGALSGVFGNYLWDKIQKNNKSTKAHVSAKTTDHGTEFTALVTSANKQQALNMLNSSVTTTTTPKVQGKASTNSATIKSSATTKTD